MTSPSKAERDELVGYILLGMDRMKKEDPKRFTELLHNFKMTEEETRQYVKNTLTNTEEE